ncbi:MAG: aminodeoxychorismate synthase component I [Candidatus Gastranaerophilales bacterium]|nr:aminodeoxychorismate synthase component I [Candidatus Gastranaerophilales bacterium]
MQIFGDKIFKNKSETIEAFNNEEFAEAFKKIEKYRQTHFLLGYIRYEAKEIFLKKQLQSKAPLLYFEVFEKYENFIPKQAENIYINPKPVMGFSEYKEKIEKIKYEIQEGNTYEVNFTHDFPVKYQGDDFELFNHLLYRQKTPYCAFLKNKYDTVLCFSPELFFELDNKNHIITKPMKGTVKRGLSEKEDLALKTFLQNDEKNRAENTMIVDLLRNDLGKIAVAGSVKATKLFAVETYPTLHQMISQVEADLKDDTSLLEIFEAIFPCGSITGAPKISTMNIIDRLEIGQRDIYCGAIGLISPQGALFNVPIRILQKSTGENIFRYRSGGAVVWDSTAKDEWEETITKAKFLTPDFEILETIRIQNKTALFEKEHLQRMEAAAKYYSVPFDRNRIKLNLENDCMARILLSQKGYVKIEYKKITDNSIDKIKISDKTVNSQDEFLYFKTTFRPYYSVNYSQIYDEIYFNEKRELTEGSRTNIFLEINGILYTPPLDCGLLNGIYRQKLLNENKCAEKILYREDLLKADKIYCANSVRGLKEVKLI